MLRDFDSAGLRSLPSSRGGAPSSPRSFVTSQSIQVMLHQETGRMPSTFLSRIFSRASCQKDRELQALETFGDRVMDLYMRYEITRICPNLNSKVIEEVVQKRTQNSALARYATRLGLGKLTGESEKALADRLEMLAGFVFLHGGFKTLRTLLTWDVQRPLIPTKEDLTLAQYMSVARLPPNVEDRIGEFGLTANAIGGVNYNNRHWIRERDCRLTAERLEKRIETLGRGVIETVLLAFAREREPYRTPNLLTKVRILIYRVRNLPESDLRHGVTVMFHGKHVSVFDPDFIRHVGNEALNSGALQCCRKYLGDNHLRHSMHVLMERSIPISNLRKPSATKELEALTFPKKTPPAIGHNRENKRDNKGYDYNNHHRRDKGVCHVRRSYRSRRSSSHGPQAQYASLSS